jgi:hypothetical protein
LNSVWSVVASLARRPDMTGGRIVVTNQSGDVVILVGAATARSYAAGSNDAKIPPVGDSPRPAKASGSPASSPIQRPSARKLIRLAGERPKSRSGGRDD